MGFQEAESVLHPLAHLVHAHVAALIGHLRGQDEHLVGLLVVAQPLGKGVHEPLRDAAHAEALHDDAVVQAEDLRDHAGVHAGDELEQEHPGVHGAAELHRAGGPGRRHIAHQTVALHQCQLREVDRGKGVVADGLVLFGTGAGNDVPAKHHHHAPAARVQCTDHAVAQVFLGVGDLVGDGLLGTGEDDGLVRVLDEVRKCRCGIGQRIGAVADDETIVQGVVFLNGAGHHQPVFLAEVGAVDAAQGQRFRDAQVVELRKMGQQLVAAEHGPEALRSMYAGNGAAGGNEKNALFGHKKPPWQKIREANPV